MCSDSAKLDHNLESFMITSGHLTDGLILLCHKDISLGRSYITPYYTPRQSHTSTVRIKGEFKANVLFGASHSQRLILRHSLTSHFQLLLSQLHYIM